MSGRPRHWTHDRPHFFKYVSRAAGRAVLTGRKLRWSRPSRFNDPFDIQFDLHIEVDQKRARAKALQGLWEASYSERPAAAENLLGSIAATARGIFPKLPRDEFDRQFGEVFDLGLEGLYRRLPETQEELRKQMAGAKLLCLSEIHDNILMWSHYAENHMGFVLQFRCITESDSAWGAALPVQYSSKMPRLIDDEFLVEMASGRASFDVHEILHKLVYTKASEWAYEKEWRICIGEGRNPNMEYEDIPFNPLELDCVYLGCQMPDIDRLNIIALISQNYSHARVVQAKKADREFSLVFQEYKNFR